MRKLLTAVVLAGMMALTCAASPIGVLDIAGLGNIRVTATSLDFGPAFGDGTGNFIVTNGTGGYSVLPLAALGQITDLNIATAPPGPPLATPIDPFLLVPSPGARFRFNLEQILLGGGVACTPAPAVGASCSPIEVVPNTPFVLTQNQGAVTGSLSVRGTATDLLDGSSAPYIGLFTFNLTVPNTIPGVLAAFGPAGPGFVESSWSAQFNAVPEPGAVFLMLGGLGVVAFRVRRKSC